MPPPRGSHVTPVVDYEPPPHAVPQHRPGALAPPRPRAPRPPVGAPRQPAGALSPELRAAAGFADTALRAVLEVIDRRRPVKALGPLLAAGLVDSVLALHPAGGAATLQRVRVRAVGPDNPPTAVEVFGTYQRGRRVHAVAGRIIREPTGTPPRWRVVALHIG